MTSRIAVFIANYNMGERADALYEFIERKTSYPTDIYLVDNASDITPPAAHTNVWIQPRNKQTTAAWLAGLREAQKRYPWSGDPKCHPYLAYAFMITSADFPETTGDPITPMAELLSSDNNAVGVHAALTEDNTTSWAHLITRPLPERSSDEPIEDILLFTSGYARRTWFIDNIFSMYRADWFDSIGWFDPELRYAWGIDLETCYKARQQGRGLYVHEGVRIRKVTDIAYRMERMRMSADERRALAGQNVTIVLERKYGAGWRELMYNGLVTDDLR